MPRREFSRELELDSSRQIKHDRGQDHGLNELDLNANANAQSASVNPRVRAHTSDITLGSTGGQRQRDASSSMSHPSRSPLHSVNVIWATNMGVS